MLTPPTTTAADYRFNIAERLHRHTLLKRKKILDAVIKKSHSSKPTVKRVIYHTWTDQSVPNYYVLKAFSKVLDVPIEELENPQP